MSLIQPFKIFLAHLLIYGINLVLLGSTLAATDNRLKQSSGQMLILLKILTFLLDGVELPKMLAVKSLRVCHCG